MTSINETKTAKKRVIKKKNYQKKKIEKKQTSVKIVITNKLLTISLQVHIRNNNSTKTPDKNKQTKKKKTNDLLLYRSKLNNSCPKKLSLFKSKYQFQYQQFDTCVIRQILSFYLFYLFYFH